MCWPWRAPRNPTAQRDVSARQSQVIASFKERQAIFTRPTLCLDIFRDSEGRLSVSAECDVLVESLVKEGSALYDIKEATLQELRPDVILTQALCTVCAVDTGLVYKYAR